MMLLREKWRLKIFYNEGKDSSKGERGRMLSTCEHKKLFLFQPAQKKTNFFAVFLLFFTLLRLFLLPHSIFVLIFCWSWKFKSQKALLYCTKSGFFFLFKKKIYFTLTSSKKSRLSCQFGELPRFDAILVH